MTDKTPEYDKVTEASLNGIYVKARELDRGDNWWSAPDTLPPGAIGDAESHASTHASGKADAETCASGARSGAGDAETRASDATSHASE